MNILSFLYGLREAEMKSCLWQPEAPDTALSSQPWHDELLSSSESQGGLPGAAAAVGPLGQEKPSNPIAGAAEIPLTEQLLPWPAALGWRTCLAFRRCGSCRMNLRGEKPEQGNQWCSHTPGAQQGLSVPWADRFSISPQPHTPVLQAQGPTTAPHR